MSGSSPSSNAAGSREPLRAPVSPWWRVIAVVLAAALAVFGLSVAVFFPASSATLTKVEWSYYVIPGGPGVDNNVTTIPGGHFCAPTDAVTDGIFSMIWNSSTGGSVQQVRLWTLYPPTSSYPLGVPVVLYESVNNSSGGTSFLSLFPEPCSNTWFLNVESDQSVVVSATATLTYNYTN